MARVSITRAAVSLGSRKGKLSSPRVQAPALVKLSTAQLTSTHPENLILRNGSISACPRNENEVQIMMRSGRSQKTKATDWPTAAQRKAPSVLAAEPAALMRALCGLMATPRLAFDTSSVPLPQPLRRARSMPEDKAQPSGALSIQTKT